MDFKLDTTPLRTDRRATDNSWFKKLAVQLRNRQPLKPANRCDSFFK
jgi:hypothetical protein